VANCCVQLILYICDGSIRSAAAAIGKSEGIQGRRVSYCGEGVSFLCRLLLLVIHQFRSRWRWPTHHNPRSLARHHTSTAGVPPSSSSSSSLSLSLSLSLSAFHLQPFPFLLLIFSLIRLSIVYEKVHFS